MRDSMSRKRMAEVRSTVRLFPEFRKVLLGNDEAMEAIPGTTLNRYVQGQLPQVCAWFVHYPELLLALYKDAQGMTDEQKAEFLKSFEVRTKDRKAALEGRAKRRKRKIVDGGAK